MRNNNKNRRKMQWLRLLLGIRQMIHNPLLAIFLLPILIFTIKLWLEKDWILHMFDVPAILFPVWKYSVGFCLVVFPIMALVIMIYTIGSITAKKDEDKLQKAFEEHDLRNGCPILINKKRMKGSNVILREFYSEIDIGTWHKREKEILHQFNAHYARALEHGGRKNNNSKIIRTYMASGVKFEDKGELHDEEL